MKIIDAHIHTSFQREDWQKIAKAGKIDFSLTGLKSEMKKNSIDYVVSLTDTFADKTPIGYDWLIEQMRSIKNMIGVCGINPLRTNAESIRILRSLLSQKLIRGMKIYSGYYAKYPTDKCYSKIYKLAQEFDVPIIFHTGDTLFKNALLKYAHPLIIDEVAVKYHDLKIVIAHCGNPWFIDAAAVAYKNENVYLDLSAMSFQAIDLSITKQLDFVQNYAGCDKLIYGSDWPLINMKDYIKFMKSIIPQRYHNKVFYKTAAKLFKIS